MVTKLPKVGKFIFIVDVHVIDYWKLTWLLQMVL